LDVRRVYSIVTMRMARRGAAITLVVLLALAGGPGCSLKPQPPPASPPTIVDTTLPLPRVEPAPTVAATPSREAATVDVEVAQPPETTAVTPVEEARSTSPAPVARPLTESDPFRTDSLDGNRFGRQLVKQILRTPGQEPSESGVTSATDEP